VPADAFALGFARPARAAAPAHTMVRPVMRSPVIVRPVFRPATLVSRAGYVPTSHAGMVARRFPFATSTHLPTTPVFRSALHSAAPTTSNVMGAKTAFAPNPVSNDITTLNNRAQSDLKQAHRDAILATADRRRAADDLQKANAAARQAATLRHNGNALIAAGQKIGSPALIGAGRAELAKAAGLRVSAESLRKQATQLQSQAGSLQRQASNLTRSAHAEIDAANRLANGTNGGQGNGNVGGQGNGTNGGGQGNGTGGGSTIGGGAQTAGGGGVGTQNPGTAVLMPATSPAAVTQAPSTLQPTTGTNGAPSQPQGQLPAIALGWNADGRWVVRTAAKLQDAANDAVQTCNAQYGGCMVSDAAVPEASYGCLVVASAADNASRLFAATGSTPDAARAIVVQQLGNAGLTGTLQYSGCNA
jgi:hypothetical protein